VLRRLERKQFVHRARSSTLAGEAEYSFRHVLLRDVAYGQIPRAARAEKHLHAAEWLEGVGRVEDHAELLSEHYLSAIGYLGASADVPPGALRALREAGDRAALLAGYAAAVRFYRAALELAPPDAAARADLLVRLGRALFSAESAGREELEAAYDAARAAGDNEAAAEAALGRRMIAWYDGDGAGADRWLDEALELVRDRPDSPVKAEVLTVQGGTQLVKGNYAEAIRLGKEALPLAERLGLELFQARIFGRTGTARVSLGDPGGIEDLERAMEITRRVGAYAELHAAWNNFSESLFLLGRVDEAARSYEGLMESLERFARDTDRRWGRAAMGALRASEGRWDEALTFLEPYLAEVEAGSPHYLESPARYSRATIRLGRDDHPGAAQDAELAVAAGRAAGDSQVLAPALAIEAVVLMTEGKRDEAERYLDELLAYGAYLPALISGFGTGIVGVAWLSRDLERYGRLVELLEAAPALPWIAAAHAIATRDFERAATVLAETGSRPPEAYTRLRAAEELSAAGDCEGAARHLELAAAFYSRVGATYYLRRCRAIEAQLSPSASSARNP
jgi:tetratricopeptide (TPR) repeat protein